MDLALLALIVTSCKNTIVIEWCDRLTSLNTLLMIRLAVFARELVVSVMNGLLLEFLTWQYVLSVKKVIKDRLDNTQFIDFILSVCEARSKRRWSTL